MESVLVSTIGTALIEYKSCSSVCVLGCYELSEKDSPIAVSTRRRRGCPKASP
jgi:hypothetical protein